MDSQTLKEEIEHSQELIKIYVKSLRVLEIQSAKFGILVPQHIQIEIEMLRERIQNHRDSISIKNKILSAQKKLSYMKIQLKIYNTRIEDYENSKITRTSKRMFFASNNNTNKKYRELINKDINEINIEIDKLFRELESLTLE